MDGWRGLELVRDLLLVGDCVGLRVIGLIVATAAVHVAVPFLIIASTNYWPDPF